MSGDTSTVEFIRFEAIRLLKDNGPHALHPDSRIILASLLFADAEGVAVMPRDQLRRWLAMPGRNRASARFVEERIGVLIAAGALAPGSTPTELRSMIARSAEEDE